MSTRARSPEIFEPNQDDTVGVTGTVPPTPAPAALSAAPPAFVPALPAPGSLPPASDSEAPLVPAVADEPALGTATPVPAPPAEPEALLPQAETNSGAKHRQNTASKVRVRTSASVRRAIVQRANNLLIQPEKCDFRAVRRTLTHVEEERFPLGATRHDSVYFE